MPRHHPSRQRRPRHGRILTECIVALALAAVAISATMTLSRAALLLADEARLVTSLAATTTAVAERATADACISAAESGTATAPRIATTWTDAIAPTTTQDVRQRHIQSTLLFSPLAHRDSTTLTINAAGVCPW